jgi:hypothetical protein
MKQPRRIVEEGLKIRGKDSARQTRSYPRRGFVVVAKPRSANNALGNLSTGLAEVS